MTLQRRDIEILLVEIKEFFGAEWFETELGKAGKIPDPKTTHPVIYSWHKTDSFLGHKNPLPGLKIIPRNDLLHIMMLGSYLRSITDADVIDLDGNALPITIRDHFYKRLRNTPEYQSAFLEIQVACLYLRKGYRVRFIDDKRPSPEFVIGLDGSQIHVECKRIEKKQVSKAEGDAIRKVHNNLRRELLHKKLGLIVVCPDTFSNSNKRIERKVQAMIATGRIPIEENVEGYWIKLFSPHISREFPGLDIGLNTSRFIQGEWFPFLDKHLSKYSVSHKDVLFYNGLPKVRSTPNSHIMEVERYFGVAFQVMPVIIFGIKKLISKASGQLPKGGTGIIYIETPPYDATDDQINEFQRVVNKELTATSRVNALVLVGRLSDTNSVQYISNIIMNPNAKTPLPGGFEILPLVDRFNVN